MLALDWIAYVIAYTRRAVYVISYKHPCVIDFCMLVMSLFQQHLANFCWFLNSDSET